MNNLQNSDADLLQEIWSKAPSEAYHWERFPNGRCIWHCRANGKSFDKKAPNFEIQKNSLWRDADKQKEADLAKESINRQLKERNIILV